MPGAPDLYFADHDSSGVGSASQPAGKDLNDRLLINDGSGFFTDESQLRMTPAMLQSAFATSSAIGDVNSDGVADVIKNTSLMGPIDVVISYNDPHQAGHFPVLNKPTTLAPYYVNTGDLNNDGKLDLIISDDGADYFKLNLGNGPGGLAKWGASQTYDFLAGGDDGFGQNNIAVDLDGDGWADTLHADIDADIGGFNRRLHIYHNRGTTPGQTTLILREERKSTSDNDWIGAVGLHKADLDATFDVAPFDIDNDGHTDLVIGRKDGTQVWMNGNPVVICGTASYGAAASPANTLDLSATGTASIGSTLTFTTSNVAGSSVFIASSNAQDHDPLLGAIVLVDVTQPLLPLVLTPTVGTQSTWALAVPVDPALVGLKAFFQSASPDVSQPLGWAFSNGVAVTVCP